MTCYYLRIEGTNMDHFVYDTNDLSTIRGGGLIMLALAEKIRDYLPKDKLEEISIGASWGLFGLKAENDEAVLQLIDQINNQLNKESVPFQYATWSIDAVRCCADYKLDRDRVHALNRWRQIQSLSLVLPEQEQPDNLPTDKKEKVVCGIDFVRPAFKWLDDEKISVSHHVSGRRIYGRDQKQGFYSTITDIRDRMFTNDLNEISAPDKEGCLPEILGNLRGKMAVVYLDGNNFGSIQRDKCDDEKDQQDFNKTVKNHHNDFLKKLLLNIKDDPEWLNSNNGEKKIRFETLLWGGDEIMWVVPAWQGWWLLGKFFEQPAAMFKGQPLTYAGGLVFSNHKAPIHRIKNLAHDLADLAKQKDKESSYVAYQVLESFDHIGTNLDKFRKLHCPPGMAPSDLIVKGRRMLSAIPAVEKLKLEIDFSKRKLHQVIRAAFDGDMEVMNEMIKKAGFMEMEALRDIKRCFGDEPLCYLHLLELWDYLGQEEG